MKKFKSEENQKDDNITTNLDYKTDMALIPCFQQLDNLFTENPKRWRIGFLKAKGVQDFNLDNCTDSQKTLAHITEGITDPAHFWQLSDLRVKQNSPVHAFFIRQKNSNSRLLLSRELLESLVTSNCIFERFTEFVLSFGWKKREDDIGPPPCHFEAGDEIHQNNFVNFECVYGLRYVECNGYGQGKDPWSVRQTTIYQKYQGDKETWVFISASKDSETKINQYIEDFPPQYTKSKNPFDLHLVLIDAALENWRWYIKNLGERTTEYSSRIIAATVEKEENTSFIEFGLNVEDRQILKVIEDKTLDMFTIFESMTDTISTLLQEYEHISSGVKFNRRDRTVLRLKENFRAVELYRKKVKTLHKRIKGTASLLSDLLEYQNAKTAEGNGDSLKILAQESREENSAIRLLTEKSTNDAAAVKVITSITIVYLPTTVVSGFFSTQFVHPSEDGRTLNVLGNWWIIAAISVPLTIITIAIWYCWIRFPWRQWRDETARRWRRPLPWRGDPQLPKLELQPPQNKAYSELAIWETGTCGVRGASHQV